MLYEKIYLKELYELNTDAFIEIAVPYNNDSLMREKSKAIVIVPGGSYSFTSNREADPVAIEYQRQGFVTIVLRYTVKTEYPVPMKELAFTVDYIRKNAFRYYIDKDKITIIGFSAGGHLTASYGYLYKKQEFLREVSLEADMIKPNCLVLSYPVITMGDLTHLESKLNITSNKEENIKLLSVENNIDSSYPPTFVWTTMEDTCVPYQNSSLLVASLEKNNVPHEYFLYPYLDHGLSVISPLIHLPEELEDNAFIEVSKWFDKSVEFIKKILD